MTQHKSTVLISFLGKNTTDPQKGYQTANYEIAGEVYESAYFGLALAEHLRPQRMLLLGTAGSMWDVLIEAHAEDNQHEAARLRLIDLARTNSVDEATLQELSPVIAQRLGCEVSLKIIPYAQEMSEQIAVLNTIAQEVQQGETVIMDVTHGFRHLPMLSLVAAHYLERVKQIKVSQLYYGALDMRRNPRTPEARTPVLELSGLLRTMDWIQAFAAYDASGNYAPFADLLRQEGWSDSECNSLREAAFFERTTNVVKARAALSGLSKALARRSSAFLKLFGEELQKRLSWWKPASRAEQEIQLADNYYKQGDYLRASIFTQEACLSAALPPDKQNDFTKEREEIRKTMQFADGRFERLSDIRNAMAHGVKGWRQESAKALQNEQNLRATLGDFIKNWHTLGKSAG